jgi:hypothetical protein
VGGGGGYSARQGGTSGGDKPPSAFPKRSVRSGVSNLAKISSLASAFDVAQRSTPARVCTHASVTSKSAPRQARAALRPRARAVATWMGGHVASHVDVHSKERRREPHILGWHNLLDHTTRVIQYTSIYLQCSVIDRCEPVLSLCVSRSRKLTRSPEHS